MTVTDLLKTLLNDLSNGGIPSNGPRPTPNLTTTAGTIDAAAVVAYYGGLSNDLILAQEKLAAVEGKLAGITVSNLISEIAFRVSSPSAPPDEILNLIPAIAAASALVANLDDLETALEAAITTPRQSEVTNFIAKYGATLNAAGIST